MKQLSIDVVLLPSEEIVDLALEWNARLLEVYPDRICLGKKFTVPHISLAMACLPIAEMSQVEKWLAAIAADTKQLSLHIPGIKVVYNPAGEAISSFDIRPDAELRSLHERIVTGLSRLSTGPATPESTADPGGVGASALQWISDYLSRHSFEAFWPHITLGYGQVEADFPAQDFVASRLAVFHLGNHCTCERPLLEWELKS